MEDILIGGFSGVVSRTFAAPLERLKILRQNKLDDKTYRNQGAFRYIFRNEGIRGLFKGNMINCTRILPQTALQYSIYNFSYNNLNIKNDTLKKLTSGAFAGAGAYTFIYPIELVRVRYSMQTQINVPIINNLYDGLKHIYNGDKKFFRGWASTMGGIVPFMALNFTSFNLLKSNFNPEDSKIKNFIFGSMGGIFSLATCYPTELIRRRLQLQNFYDKYPIYKSVPDVIKKVYKNEGGIKAFYKGLSTALMRIGVSNGFYFLTIELIKSKLDEYRSNKKIE